MKRYHSFLITLHWLLAILLIASLFMGSNVLSEIPNSDPEKIFSLRIHMSIGITILVLTIIRLVVRLKSQKPPHADIGNALLNKLGVLAHYVLYLLVILMAVSGIGISIMAGLPDIVFGGSGAALPSSFDEFLPRAVHGIIATLLLITIAAHVLAALYHQFVRKDALLSRMWFGKRF